MGKLLDITVAVLFVCMPMAAEAAGIYEPPAAPVAGSELRPQEFITDAFEAANNGVEVVFPYIRSNVYKIYLQEGFVTDIRLEPNETVKYIGGGDTMRWKIDTAEAGRVGENRTHIFVKPLQGGISTNLIINTDRRVYQLILESGRMYNPMVSWSFPKSEEELRFEEKVKVYSRINPLNMKFGYKISNKSLKWAPEDAFRTDSKTYFKMKPDIVNTELPAFFAIDDEGKLLLVSFRYLDGYFIVDRLVDKGVFVLGKEQVKVTFRG